MIFCYDLDLQCSTEIYVVKAYSSGLGDHGAIFKRWDLEGGHQALGHSADWFVGFQALSLFIFHAQAMR